MNISNLFYFTYWFKQPYPAYGFTLWLWVIGFLVLFLAGLVLLFLRVNEKIKSDKINSEVMRRFGNLALFMGLWGFIWLFFRQERVAFLAWRFWLLLWGVVFVFWSYKIIFYIVKRVPKIKEDYLKREIKNKYLPKSKRK